MFKPDELKQHYSGDQAKLQKAIDDSNENTLSWESIEVYGTILPELADEAEEIITQYLGYGVKHAISIPHEPFIRVLILNYKQGAISKEVFIENIQSHIKNIRNQDIKSGGWLRGLDLSSEHLELYESKQVHFKDKARKRLSAFLTYEPELKHSLLAEMVMRQAMSYDDFDPSWSITPYDYKALTIIRYLEIFDKYGEAAADDSPLLALVE